MLLIVGLVVVASCFGFYTSYKIGVMELLLLHGALIGLPLLAESFLMKPATKDYFAKMGTDPRHKRDVWLFLGAYLFFAVSIYYQAVPIVTARMNAAQQAQAFVLVFPMALVMAFPLMTIVILLLDFKDVWSDLIRRREGLPTHTPPRGTKSSSYSTPVETLSESDDFDPALFKRHTPQSGMNIKQEKGSVVRGVNFGRKPPDGTLH